MAWTAPATWSVGEVVVASKMNLHIRDNLAYLKASPQFDGTIGVGVAASASYVAYLKNGALPMRLELSTSGINWLELRSASVDATNKWALRIRDLAEGDFSIYDMTAALQRLYINSVGNVGLGTTAPQGKIHAVGAGGGWLFLSANAVNNTLQTLAVAGTVTVGMIVWLCDRNNTAGAFTSGFNGQVFSLTSALTYINTDTLTLTLTAGGAITIQRTTGSNGTHQVNLALMYF